MAIIETGNKRYIIDDETGEILHEHIKKEVWLQDGEKTAVFKPGRKRDKPTNPEFIKLYRTNVIDVITRDFDTSEDDTDRPGKSKKKKLSMLERGVFLSMLVFIDWESNYIVDPKTKQLLNDSTLAALIGYDRAHLVEVTKSLNNRGLIAIIKNGNGRGNSYMINSNLVFNGRKMKDINEHKVFEVSAYKPAIPVKYAQEDAKKK